MPVFHAVGEHGSDTDQWPTYLTFVEGNARRLSTASQDGIGCAPNTQTPCACGVDYPLPIEQTGSQWLFCVLHLGRNRLPLLPFGYRVEMSTVGVLRLRAKGVLPSRSADFLLKRR